MKERIIIGLVFMANLLNILDIATTTFNMQNPLSFEANPFMLILWATFGFAGGFTVKVLMLLFPSIICLVIYHHIRNSEGMQPVNKIGVICLSILNAISLFVVANNLWVSIHIW